VHEKLSELIEGIIVKHKYEMITGYHKKAVLAIEIDLMAMKETLHLLFVPGKLDSIQSS
jgi:hypothetical protein